MSFSSDAKAELCRVPLTRRCCARAEAYGVLLYAGIFSPTEVRIVTESEDFAARLPKLFQKAFGVRFDAQESGSKSIFRITDGQKLRAAGGGVLPRVVPARGLSCGRQRDRSAQALPS